MGLAIAIIVGLPLSILVIKGLRACTRTDRLKEVSRVNRNASRVCPKSDVYSIVTKK